MWECPKVTGIPVSSWLPPGKQAAVCFTIDDVHPGRSSDAYEAGGDLERGALGRAAWLLERHPFLRTTLFVTPDWRELSAVPTRRILRTIPLLRERIFLARVLPRGTMRLDRHPAFVAYLRSLPRTEIGLHGLHHVHRGERIFQEFQEEGPDECETILRKAISIFEAAGLPHVLGMTPPGWDASPGLLTAMSRLGFTFVASARDLRTPIAPGATAQMSGLRGVSLTRPALVADGALVHFTTNFQATTPIERAFEVVRCGGLLAVKAHIVKSAFGLVMLDGLDDLYANYLDLLFRELHRAFGASLWWTTMGEIAARLRGENRVSGHGPAPALEAALSGVSR
jgi:hypothetical protein